LPSAVQALGAVARSGEPADRREAAIMAAAHAGDAGALAVARALLGDVDVGVRAQAAWTLGVLGDASDAARLEAVARGPEVDAATDATAAIGRVAARTHGVDAARSLCALTAAAHPYVRANALAGLAIAGARCADGSIVRKLLAGDPSDEARAAAAIALSRAPEPEDARALERCARTDPSGAVATRCRTRWAPTPRTHAALVYIVPEGAVSPRPGAPYALLMADGTLRVGTADRRGAVFDPAAPEGDVTLRRPSALAR
jgi:HEAT repeat protein